MVKGLMSLLIGPRLSPEEREGVIAYYNKASQVIMLQDREAERYNAMMLQHGSHLDSPESAKALADASHRLALCAKELIRRHANLGPVPDLAARSYAAWHVVYLFYDEWAGAVHAALTAISEGRTPFGRGRVQEFFREMETKRKAAEREDRKMLKAAGLKPSDLPRLIAAAHEVGAGSDWES